VAGAVLLGATAVPQAAAERAGHGKAATAFAAGRMLRADGSAAAGAEVTVVALRESGGIESAVVVGRSRTDADGEWSIPPPGRSYGTRSFEVRTVVDGKPLLYDFVQRPGDKPSLGAQMGSHLSLRAGLGRVGSTGEPRSGSLVALPGQVDAAEPISGPRDALTMPTASAPLAKPSCTYVFVAQNRYKRVWVPLKVSRTRSKSTLSYKWSTTRETDLAVVISTPERKVMGGLTGSSRERSRMTLRPRWRNHESKLVKAQWRYRRHRAWCLGGPPPSDPPRPLNIWKWKPYRATGFTRKVDNTPTFKCRAKGPVASELTLDNRAAVRWQGWFSIVGVALDGKQTQTTDTSLKIVPDPGKTPRYCGSAKDLDYSSFVREIK
jgi:hypothetical protein